MEKQGKPKNSLLKLLPKVVSGMRFQAPPFSPGMERRTDKQTSRASTIPVEARRRSRELPFDSPEPTSPKISCVGQIKQKARTKPKKGPLSDNRELKKQLSVIERVLGRKGRRKKSYVTEEGENFNTLKRFSSGRNVLKDWNWSERDCYSEAEDGEKITSSAPFKLEKEGELQGRKEVNLWKRRTIAPPLPLQLSPTSMLD